MLNQLVETVGNNQLLTAILGFSGASIVGFWVKDVPRMFGRFLKRELSTELTITSYNMSYHNLLKWIEKNYKDKKFRNLKLSNGKWGENDETITSIGYGFHTIWYGGCILFIHLIKESANNTERDKELISIKKIGRSRDIFNKLIMEINDIDDSDGINIYKMLPDGFWSDSKLLQRRLFDSIFIENYKKNLLINTLTDFISKEDWYLDNGIPYQLGILLYGSPGTGKTSIIKAISSYLKYPIYYIPADNMYSIERGLSNIPNKCIVVIEDIDTNSVTHKRNPDKNTNNILGFNVDEITSTSLSGILNSLDGIFSVHGRILIATTNHIENLDPALIRPGRIDLKLEIDSINIEILSLFLNKFFPNNVSNIIDIKIKDNITVAMLQNMVLSNYRYDKILEEIAQ